MLTEFELFPLISIGLLVEVNKSGKIENNWLRLKTGLFKAVLKFDKLSILESWLQSGLMKL